MKTFKRHEKGQSLVEYALIIVLIAIVVIAAMQFLAPTIGNVFSQIGNTLENVNHSADNSGSAEPVDWGSHDYHDHNHDD